MQNQITGFHLFDLTVRWEPRSALFPYTTLFRSALDPTDPSGVRRRGFGCRLASPADARGSRCDRCRDGPLDRKSTRLNSSHRCISYAVFCLKKKLDL